jgi:large subunit ribosomal protein L31e
MTEEKAKPIEREYVIPLRREWLKVEEYRRAGRAAKAVKQFIAKHMKIPERDVDKVKLDMYLNNEIWFRGKRHPPSKIKVKAIKEGDIVRVEFVETPQYVKFLKAKHERLHKEAGKEEKKEEAKPEEKPAEEKKEIVEEKKTEVEKEKSVEEKQIKEAKEEKKIQKHAAADKKIEFHRRSMNRH